MQALDGFFFAARRDAALAVGFDEEAFDGFHFYDLDFTYRAHAAGLKLAVTTEVCALHRSLGNFGEEWRRYSQRFAQKFPGLGAARGANHHYAAHLSSRDNAVRFLRQMRGLARA
jgi:GT2 family glycosyltransferase